MTSTILSQYQQRLTNLPQVNKQLSDDIKKYQSLISDQNSQLSIQNVKIKAMESELLKFDKQLDKIENQITELSENQSKNVNKEKKYLMQIDNYNKKIDSTKAEHNKIAKSCALLKKQIKSLESQTITSKSQKNKIEQILTKQQIKINSFTQTLNDLKLKIMEQGHPGGQGKSKLDIGTQIERDEKHIGELFNAIKKQMALIDVLKRQKVHLIASTVFNHCEQDFQKVLEMNKDK